MIQKKLNTPIKEHVGMLTLPHLSKLESKKKNELQIFQKCWEDGIRHNEISEISKLKWKMVSSNF